MQLKNKKISANLAPPKMTTTQSNLEQKEVKGGSISALTLALENKTVARKLTMTTAILVASKMQKPLQQGF
jgi:hypothetical protein